MQKTDRVHFLTTNGTLRRKDNNLLFVKTDEEGREGESRYLPIEMIDELYILAKTQLDSETLAFLGDNNILVHIFTHYGAFRGNFYPSTPNSVNKSGFVLLSQLRAFDDPKHRLYIAKAITKAHLQNALGNLKRYEADDGLAIDEIIDSIERQESIEALMGAEGSFKKRYYEAWNRIIKNQRSFKFVERSKRPPRDKINLLISYFNTRIYNICLSEIYKTELDPRIGYLHEPNFRSLSLHLDLAEIFKPLIADGLIFTMLNKEELKAGDFESDSGRLRIHKEAIKRIELRFIERLTSTIEINIGGSKQSLTWRQVIRREANRLKKCICEFSEYEGFIRA